MLDDSRGKINKLREYFEKRDDILMAFLFGSYAKGYARSVSDWDLAVYFKPPENGRIEWEEQCHEYPEREMREDLSALLKSDNVDLIVLNRAPAVVADTAIRGLTLVVKDHNLWLEYMLRVTGAAEDFREFARDYSKIYQRSLSLTRQDAYSLDRRLMFIDDEWSVFIDFINLTWQEYQSDRARQRIVERSIEKLMNAVIDISKMVLASEKRPIPESSRDVVLQTGLIVPFSTDLTEKLSKWVGLRNILAHEYLDYRWKEISEFLRGAPAVFPLFKDAARKFLDERQK